MVRRWQWSNSECIGSLVSRSGKSDGVPGWAKMHIKRVRQRRKDYEHCGGTAQQIPGAGSAQSHKRSDAGPRRLSVGFGQRRGTKSNRGGGSPVAGSRASCQYDFCYQVDRSSSLPTHLRMIVICSGVSMLWTAPQEIQMEGRSACRQVHQTDKAGPHVVLEVAARHIFWTDRDHVTRGS